MTEPQARRVAVTRRGSGGARAVVTPAPPTRDPIYVCGACGAPAALGWQRRANPAELARFVLEGRVGPDEAATVPVFGCAVHKLDGDAAARVHEAHCAAPPACGCTPVLVEVPDPSFPKTVLGN